MIYDLHLQDIMCNKDRSLKEQKKHQNITQLKVMSNFFKAVIMPHKSAGFVTCYLCFLYDIWLEN